MNDLLSKLSSYNLFNYLLPGVLFVVLADKLTPFSFVQKDLVIGVFLYYFVGMVISRIGSLLVEPLLKTTKFVRFADYGDFVRAAAKDQKLEVMSEANNTYRTLCALVFSLGVLKLVALLEGWQPALVYWNTSILTLGLLVLFLFSYRKQVTYIRRRIDENNRAPEDLSSSEPKA